MTQSLAVEHQGPVGLVTLNRPERHNAFDDALIAELTQALREMEGDETVRIVVLSGTGKSFSAGADLHWMKRMSGFSKEENQRDAMGLGALMRTLAHLRKPTVARVHGAAYGGGVGLVACCDIAVATQAASVLATVKRDGIEAKKGTWSKDEEEKFKAPIREQYERQGHPYYATARLWDDGVIDPADTRRVLGLALAAAKNAPEEPTHFGVFRM